MTTLSNKGKKWVANKYWHRTGNANWVFHSLKDGKITTQLLNHSATPIVRYVKVDGERLAPIVSEGRRTVKGNTSPYDGNMKYLNICYR